ncbi:MAG TPA: hypothetical protein DD399_10250, partial [Alcanivorax sp.]|nr:hypothetical protein [Alcanivorax sp.]
GGRGQPLTFRARPGKGNELHVEVRIDRGDRRSLFARWACHDQITRPILCGWVPQHGVETVRQALNRGGGR